MALQITDAQKTGVIDPLNTALESAFSGGVASPSYPSILAPMTKYAGLSDADRQAIKDVFRQVLAAYVNVGGGGGGSGSVSGSGTSQNLTMWTGPSSIGNSGFTKDAAGRLSVPVGIAFPGGTQDAPGTTGSGTTGNLVAWTGSKTLGNATSEGWHTVGSTGEPGFINGWGNY